MWGAYLYFWEKTGVTLYVGRCRNQRFSKVVTCDLLEIDFSVPELAWEDSSCTQTRSPYPAPTTAPTDTTPAPSPAPTKEPTDAPQTNHLGMSLPPSKGVQALTQRT